MTDMTGKIFENSSNIYQDQAKILFDYYKAAAEMIVSTEMQEEQNKADLIKQRDEMLSQAKKNKNISTVMFILFFLIAPIVIGIVYRMKSKKCLEEVQRFEQLMAESDERYRNIRRDYRVDKIGVLYVPVATRVPFEDRSIVLDHTGIVGETDLLSDTQNAKI